MSACNNLLWAGLGLAAGYALALYVDDIARSNESDDDGEGEDDLRDDLRVVDDKVESSDG